MVGAVQKHTTRFCKFISIWCQRILQRVGGQCLSKGHSSNLCCRLTAILLRNGPSNIIFFGFRDPLRNMLPQSFEQFGLLADFLSGACLGAFISTIFYPLNTTKTHMQKSLGGEFRSFGTVFSSLLRNRGVKGMFRGVHVNYTRSFMSWGIINMSYGYLLGVLRDSNL